MDNQEVNNNFMKTLTFSAIITLAGTFFYKIVILGTLLSGILLLNEVISYGDTGKELIPIFMCVIFYCFIPLVIIISNINYKSAIGEYLSAYNGLVLCAFIFIFDYVIWIICYSMGFSLIFKYYSVGYSEHIKLEVFGYSIISAIIGYLLFILLPLYFTRWKNLHKERCPKLVRLRVILPILAVIIFICSSVIVKNNVDNDKKLFQESIVKNSVKNAVDLINNKYRKSNLPVDVIAFNVFLERRLSYDNRSPFDPNYYLYDHIKAPGVVLITPINKNEIEVIGYGKGLEILSKKIVKIKTTEENEPSVLDIDAKVRQYKNSYKTKSPNKLLTYNKKYCKVSLGKFFFKDIPADLNAYAKINGISATTVIFAKMMDYTAVQLSINEDFRAAQNFKDFSNLLYFLSVIQKRIEITASYCKYDEDPYKCFKYNLYHSGYGVWPKYYKVEELLPEFDRSIDSIQKDKDFLNISSPGFVAFRKQLDPGFYTSCKTRLLSCAMFSKFQDIYEDKSLSDQTKALALIAYSIVDSLNSQLRQNVKVIVNNEGKRNELLKETIYVYNLNKGLLIKNTEVILDTQISIDELIHPKSLNVKNIKDYLSSKISTVECQ